MNGKREAKNCFFFEWASRQVNVWLSESAAKQRQKYLRAVIMNESDFYNMATFNY